MKLNQSTLTPIPSSSDLLSLKTQPMSQSLQKLVRRSSVSSTGQKRNSYIANQRRQSLFTLNNDCYIKPTSSSLSIPLLYNTLNTFFQTTQKMEDEIMLPSRLKDMPVEELVVDNAVQPDNWHEIYTFVRDIRNQLQCTHPFADDIHDNESKVKQRKDSSEDEGINITNLDNNQFSSASSTVSSEESEQSSTSSNVASFDTIKDELKCHYYGLFRSLDSLSSIANRVTEKYREESNF